MTRWNEELYDPIVRNLRHKGRPPKTILEFMLDQGYPVSLKDVRDAILRLGLATIPPRPASWAGPPLPKSRPNPIEEAYHTLRDRLSERNGAYCLDGQPTNLTMIMREVNRLRSELGLGEILANLNWHCRRSVLLASAE